MRLQDKVILVTASTRGIGLAIVKKCAEEGAKLLSVCLCHTFSNPDLQIRIMWCKMVDR
jgi:NAD(P)-dependent dehydrogenase (short-subunit alcohol dehydrogenase family)